MLFKGAATALCVALASAAPSVERRTGPSGFNWGQDKILGLNIGGWLVLEPWITPSIFQQFDSSRGIIDEYTLGKALGEQAARDQVLQKHWETWCTWKDFKKIKDSGFNAVRIPIGYWAYDNSDSPFVSGAAPFLDAAVDWARSVGLKIMIDLHGAPGSQNCLDNSGQKCEKPKWTTGNTIAKTLRVLKKIQTKYGASSYDDVIMGIQLLNEPLTPVLDKDVVRKFTRDGYNQQRKISQSRVVVFHDGFQPVNSYNGFLTPGDNNAQNVAVDHHDYQVFDPYLVSLSPLEHRHLTCNSSGSYSGSDKWTFVGEWSGAMTDCAPALNGYGIGARYDGTYPNSTYVGSCANRSFLETWDQKLRDDTRAYIEGQMDAFERFSLGWFWWNFKTEGAPEWDAFRLIDAGIFPQPLSSRKFDDVCT